MNQEHTSPCMAFMDESLVDLGENCVFALATGRMFGDIFDHVTTKANMPEVQEVDAGKVFFSLYYLARRVCQDNPVEMRNLVRFINFQLDNPPQLMAVTEDNPRRMSDG